MQRQLLLYTGWQYWLLCHRILKTGSHFVNGVTKSVAVSTHFVNLMSKSVVRNAAFRNSNASGYPLTNCFVEVTKCVNNCNTFRQPFRDYKKTVFMHISMFSPWVGWGVDSQNKPCPQEFDRRLWIRLWHRSGTLDVSARKTGRNWT